MELMKLTTIIFCQRQTKNLYKALIFQTADDMANSTEKKGQQ